MSVYAAQQALHEARWQAGDTRHDDLAPALSGVPQSAPAHDPAGPTKIWTSMRMPVQASKRLPPTLPQHLLDTACR